MLSSLFKNSGPNTDTKSATVASLQAQYDVSSSKRISDGVYPFDFMYENAIDRRSTEADKSVSVWVWSGFNHSTEDVVLQSVKRVKTLKHPLIVSYISSAVDVHKCIWLVTESVTQLSAHLTGLDKALARCAKNDDCPESGDQDLLGCHDDRIRQIRFEYLTWGVHQLFQTVAFLHNDAKLAHNSLSTSSVMVTKAGEWKLFGLHTVAPVTSPPPASDPYCKLLPPERLRHSDGSAASSDIWMLGSVLWHVFHAPRTTSESRSLQTQMGQIPPNLKSMYQAMVTNNPSQRPALTKARLAEMAFPGGYFSSDIVSALIFVDEIHIKSAAEKCEFFSQTLPSLVNRLPPFVQCYKLLPQLIAAFEMTKTDRVRLQPLQASLVVPILSTAQHLDDATFDNQVVHVVKQLFALADRNVRFKLLKNGTLFSSRLTSKTVNEHIFSHYQQGFADQEAVIRELSIFALVQLASKLNRANLDDGIVMRYFPQLMRDAQNEAIRTNATVCLAKIARSLHPTTRKKMLIAAFTSRLSDPFVPARMAAINALASSQSLFSISDTAAALLPALVTRLVDPDREIRITAFKTVRCFVDKLEQASSKPDLLPELEADLTVWDKDASISQSSAMTSSLTSAKRIGSAASTWTSWAVTAVSAKFYKTDQIQSNANNQQHHSSAQPPKLPKPTILPESTPQTDDLVSWPDAGDESATTDGWDVDDWNVPDCEPDQPSSCRPSTVQDCPLTPTRNSIVSTKDLFDSATVYSPIPADQDTVKPPTCKLGAMRLTPKSKEEQMIDDLLFS